MGNTQSRGPGFWKLNVSYLHNNEYVDVIKKTILDAYDSVKHYDDKGLIWDFVKMKIREASIRYAKVTKRKENEQEKEINSKLKSLQEQLLHNYSIEKLDKIEILKKQLENFHTN